MGCASSKPEGKPPPLPPPPLTTLPRSPSFIIAPAFSLPFSSTIESLPDINIPLPSLARSLLQFLRIVNRFPELRDSSSYAIRSAVYRYEQRWLPLLKQHNGNHSSDTTQFLPPLDVAWVSFCHSLCPLDYAADMTQLLGYIPQSSFFPSHAVYVYPFLVEDADDVEAIVTASRKVWNHGHDADDYDYIAQDCPATVHGGSPTTISKGDTKRKRWWYIERIFLSWSLIYKHGPHRKISKQKEKNNYKTVFLPSLPIATTKFNHTQLALFLQCIHTNFSF